MSARCRSPATQSFDTDCMVALLQRVIEEVAETGNSVIVGRGSPYILRNRPDVFTCLCSRRSRRRCAACARWERARRRRANWWTRSTRSAAQFIKRYFGADWPCRQLYDLMINSDRGDEYVIETILNGIALAERINTAVATHS